MNVFLSIAGEDVTAARLLGLAAAGAPEEVAGERSRAARALIELTRVLDEAASVWDRQIVPSWLRSKNSHLDGARPIDVLFLRGAQEVLFALEAEAAGAFA